MWLLLAAFPVTLFLAGYAGVLFHEARLTCRQTQAENTVLLLQEVCADPMRRLMAGPKVDATCRTAEEENRIGTYACAWKLMWENGAPNVLWQRITGSYWLLFGILAPTSCVAVMMAFWSCGQRAARHQTAQMQRELLSTLKQLAPSTAVKPKRPRHHYYETLPPPPTMYYPDPAQWTQFLLHQQQDQERQRRQGQVELLNI